MTETARNWFEIDKDGLANVAARRGSLAFVIYELVQNAWDLAGATRVDVRLVPVPGRPTVELTVSDDHPDGFQNLDDAWTMFAPSEKRADPTKRGRFCIGEKLVLALCKTAVVTTTKGTVTFDERGRTVQRNRTRPAGSSFHATLRATRDDVAEMSAAMRRLIQPDDRGVVTTFNGEPLRPRPPVVDFEVSLATELAGEDGILRRTARKTRVTLHEVLAGEQPTLYEMGIPVVEAECAWHVCVWQRVPLNAERDNVTPSYLRAVRVAVLNAAHGLLSGTDETSTSWVADAVGDGDVSDDAVRHVIRERFGDRAVINDPSDPEGTKIAVSREYTVVHGGALSGAEWANVKRARALLPAGKVTPSPKPFHPDGKPLKVLPEVEWSSAMVTFATFVGALGEYVTGSSVSLTIADDPGWGFRGAYAPGRLTVNAAALGDVWFARRRRDPAVLAFLIHELAHHSVSDHLSEAYHEACCDVGAKVAAFVLERPDLFR